MICTHLRNDDVTSLLQLCTDSQEGALAHLGDAQKLNKQQSVAFARCALLGRTTVVIGGAGVGKTWVARAIVGEVVDRFGEPSVGLIAPTGAAARIASQPKRCCATIHSYFNVRNRKRKPGSVRSVRECKPPAEEEDETVLKVAIEMSELESDAAIAPPDTEPELGGLPTAVLDKHTTEKLRKLVFLGLDEFSMVNKEMLMLVHDALCMARHCTKPFGGVTLLITGDPAQLAPVAPNGDAEWAFEASCWPPQGRVMALTQPVRQAAGSPFAVFLAKMRLGKTTQEDVDWFNAQVRRNQCVEHQLMIAPSNRKCNAENDRHLASIAHQPYQVGAVHGCTVLLSTLPWKTAEYSVKKLKFELRYPSGVPDVFVCKLGCRVRCTKNIYGGRYPNRQLEIANGQLGTVSAIDELADGPRILVLWDALAGETQPQKMYVYRALYARRQAKRSKCGLVVFATTKQFPLAVAAAITYHGSQGATVASKLRVDLNAVTKERPDGPWIATPASIYTALSRATDIANLSVVSSLRLSQIRVNTRVLRFFNLVA